MTKRLSGMFRLVPVLAVALVASACIGDAATDESTTQPPSSEVAGPHDPNAEMAPDVMELEPSVAPAGEEVSIFFPKETLRGVHFVLERQQEDDWELRYHLLSDWGGEREPQSLPAEAMEVEVEDIGIGGPGPDVVLVPEVAPPGQYRICTGNMRDNICSPLTIEPPS